MEKQRNIKLISIIVLVVGVLGITIAFALLSKSLVVNSNGKVSPQVFDIHFRNISEARVTGKAEVINAPTINSEKKAEINNLEVLLKEPQDKIEYTVYIENSSDMNAKIEEITYPSLKPDEEKIFKFSAKYEKDGSPMQVGDLLYKRQVKKVIITIEYLDITDKNLLPKEAKTIDIDFKIKYVQDNNSYDDEIQALLPDGYKECEYLESNGNQRITFETLLPSGTTAEFVSSVNNTGTYQTIFGVREVETRVEVYYTNATIGVWQRINNTIVLLSDLGSGAINAVHKTKVMLLRDLVGIKCLFSYETSGTYPLSGRIYSAIFIGDDKKYIHYFIPCLDINDKPCMYDTVSGKTFYNKGTGEFNYKLK